MPAIPEKLVHRARLLACWHVPLLPLTAAAQQPPRRPPPLTPAEVVHWREDLRFLAAEMPKRHRNLFHTLSRAEFDRAVRRLDARIPALRRHEIILELARLAARVGDGHTNVAPARDSAIAFHALPLRLYLFADGLYVRAADSAHAGLVGARVLRLGRATAEEAVMAVRPLIGRDNEMGVRFAAPFLLVMPEVLHGLGLIDDLERVPLVVERDGRREDVVLAPAGLTPLMARDTDRSWELPPGWVDARGAPEGWPLWLPSAGEQVLVRLPGAGARTLRPVQRGGRQAGPDRRAVRGQPVRLRARPPVDRLVLDLRLNGGGQRQPQPAAGARPHPGRLAERPRAPLRAHRPAHLFRGAVSGERARALDRRDLRRRADRLARQPYGDSYRIRLPNSGVTVRVSTLYWQFSDPRDHRVWTPPEVATDLTFDDYRRNRDPALEAALAWVPEPALDRADARRARPGGRPAMDSAYRAYRADPRHRYVSTEDPLNALGYALLQEHRADDAVAVFTLNTEAFPRLGQRARQPRGGAGRGWATRRRRSGRTSPPCVSIRRCRGRRTSCGRCGASGSRGAASCGLVPAPRHPERNEGHSPMHGPFAPLRVPRGRGRSRQPRTAGYLAPTSALPKRHS